MARKITLIMVALLTLAVAGRVIGAQSTKTAMVAEFLAAQQRFGNVVAESVGQLMALGGRSAAQEFITTLQQPDSTLTLEWLPEAAVIQAGPEVRALRWSELAMPVSLRTPVVIKTPTGQHAAVATLRLVASTESLRQQIWQQVRMDIMALAWLAVASLLAARLLSRRHLANASSNHGQPRHDGSKACLPPSASGPSAHPSEAVIARQQPVQTADAASQKDFATGSQARQQLQQADRLAAVGRLAAGLMHDLGTPLNVISGRASMIASGECTPGEIHENASVVHAQAHRIAAMVRGLLTFSRARKGTMDSTDIGQLVRDTVLLVEPTAHKSRVKIRTELPSAAVLGLVERTSLQHALANIMVNGVQAMNNGGALSISLTVDHCHNANRQPAAPSPHIHIAVKDQGGGIAEAIREHLFDPFFSGENRDGSTGLGLTVCHEIIAEHDGWIEVDSRLGEGSEFGIYLPQKGFS